MFIARRASILRLPVFLFFAVASAAAGFQSEQTNAAVAEQVTGVEPTALPQHHESVEVHDTTSATEQTSTSTEISAPSAMQLPGRPVSVSDVLPLVPGVVRQPGGGLAISGAGEERSSLIVNSADVTDPATGQFGLTVPMDIVQSLNVYQTPFLAEYGRFSAGVVSVETRRGGDKWKWELNDPFPDFRIRSYHMRGIRDATPRLNFEGPLIKGKLYFSQGIDYEIRKTEVFELPYPNNQKKQESVNSFTQLDWIASSRQIVTATLHIVPQRLEFVNMNLFNPQPTTPDAATRSYTGTAADKLSVWGGLLENTLSFTRFNAAVWGQGQNDFVISPQGNTGSYFAQQNRQSYRVGWTPTFTAATVHWLGDHILKTGAYFDDSSDTGQINEHNVDLTDASGSVFEQIRFLPGQPFHVNDQEMAFFGQDHWTVSPHLAFDLGVRSESQELSESFRIAPRAGLAWIPNAAIGTVIRAGFGLFYDRLPLSVYSFSHYPDEVVSFLNPSGQVTSEPFLYTNMLGTVSTKFPFVIQGQTPGNFSPRSATGSIGIEQPLTSRLKLRLNYMQSQSEGLVVLNHTTPDPITETAANVLSGNGQSRYRQLEATARFHWNDKRELFFSYVKSRDRGDLNDFSNYLGTFAVPILRNNQFGNLPADLPNRFLMWGLLQFPMGWRLAPMVEYRSGFPYAVTDITQNWVGIPYSTRFPTFFSFDARVSKDIKVNPKYTFRISVSGFNLTDNFNPEAVHYNTADPAFGAFVGQRGRHLTADFDVIF